MNVYVISFQNSVITTIEKRYEIPSSISGIIASMYEIGNVITVIFASYLGSRRHIPVFIGMGKNSSHAIFLLYDGKLTLFNYEIVSVGRDSDPKNRLAL